MIAVIGMMRMSIFRTNLKVVSPRSTLAQSSIRMTYSFSALISFSVICSTLVSSTFSISPPKDIFSISEVEMSLLTVIFNAESCDKVG